MKKQMKYIFIKGKKKQIKVKKRELEGKLIFTPSRL